MSANSNTLSDDELLEYIKETIARLERLAVRLKTFIEERDDRPVAS